MKLANVRGLSGEKSPISGFYIKYRNNYIVDIHPSTHTIEIVSSIERSPILWQPRVLEEINKYLESSDRWDIGDFKAEAVIDV